jgi:peptidoglycan/LPS O-acetylase OafA/YrhL
VNNQHSEFGFLDAARGLSAFVVLLAHIVQVHFLRFVGADSTVNAVSSALSSYAVVTFFLLSGFLITQSIEANIRRNGEFRVLSYACARIARIYPPFLVAFLLTLLIFGILEFFELPGRATPLAFPGDLYAARHLVSLTPKETVTSLLMLNGALDVNGPLWSLYMEVKLYVLFGCAYCVCLGIARVPALILGMCVLLLGLRFQADFARYAALWLLGCAAFYLFDGHVQKRMAKLWSCVAAIALFAAGGCLMVRFAGASAGFTPGKAVIELFLAAAIILLLVRFRPQLPFGKQLAPYSYTLYVIHFPLLLLLQSLLVASGWASVGGAVTISLVSMIVVLFMASWLGSVERSKRSIQSALEAAVMRVTARWRAPAAS